jgi:hypothetical protein
MLQSTYWLLRVAAVQSVKTQETGRLLVVAEAGVLFIKHLT